MCRTQKNYYGRGETIPGQLIGTDCHVTTKDSKADSFGSHYHRYETLVLNNWGNGLIVTLELIFFLV